MPPTPVTWGVRCKHDWLSVKMPLHEPQVRNNSGSRASAEGHGRLRQPSPVASLCPPALLSAPGHPLRAHSHSSSGSCSSASVQPSPSPRWWVWLLLSLHPHKECGCPHTQSPLCSVSDFRFPQDTALMSPTPYPVSATTWPLAPLTSPQWSRHPQMHTADSQLRPHLLSSHTRAVTTSLAVSIGCLYSIPLSCPGHKSDTHNMSLEWALLGPWSPLPSYKLPPVLSFQKADVPHLCSDFSEKPWATLHNHMCVLWPRDPILGLPTFSPTQN